MLADFPIPQAELVTGSDRWWKTLTDCLPVLVWCAGPDGQCIYFNERWLQFTGRTLQESIGDGWARDVHPDDRDRVFLDYHYSLQRRQKFRLEYRLRYQNGPYRWIVDFGTPVFDQHQTFLGYVGGCIDVTLVKGSGLATPWREKFEAVLDADVSQLAEKIGVAEIAIQDRLNDQRSDQIEINCLQQALATLLDIKKTKLHLG